ncbi:RAD9B family protein [Megaselia abdita]
MKCVLLGSNAKVFAKAIQSLAKYGKELFLEAQDNGLMLRTMNLPGTAFGSFIFYKDFFEEYDNAQTLLSADQNCEYENSCQISMKACLGLFKNMRQVVRCVLRIDTKASRLNVKLFCRMDTVKTHQIAIVDVESVTPSFNTDEVPNNVTVSNKVLGEIISYFQMGEEEITFDAEEDSIKIRNYVEGAKENEKALRTELGLKAGEFEQYSIGEKSSVTFNMKELKAFLLFAEAASLDIHIRFEETGTPIAFITKSFNMFEGKLVMSTLAPDDVSMYDDYERNNESEVSFAPEPPKRRNSKPEVSNNKKRREDTVMEETIASASIKSVQGIRDDTGIEEEYQENVSSVPKDESHDFHPVRPSILPEIHVPPFIPPIFNLEPDPNLTLTFKDTEELEECVQESPPRKQIRSIFTRCFEATYVPREPSPNSNFYVPNSDEE